MAAASEQIRQMVNFILQEAHEKANEIRVKVRYDTLVCVCVGWLTLGIYIYIYVVGQCAFLTCRWDNPQLLRQQQ